MSRTRAWCFTANNWTESDLQLAHDLFHKHNANYVVCGQEVGDQGTPHLQGYVHFKNVRNLEGLKNIHASWHWESAKGNAEQNFTYCSKESNFFEEGKRPMSQKDKGEIGKRHLEERWAAAKEGRFEELPPENIKIYEYIQERELSKNIPQWVPHDSTWVWGKSGTGKSRWARETYPGAYIKAPNKWWDGYKYEDTVIIEDLDKPTIDKENFQQYLKLWTDHYPFQAESKGSMRKIRPARIIVTSQYPIDQIIIDPETLTAIQRRFVNIKNT